MKKKKNFEQKWIRPNMVLEHFILALKVRALRWRNKERKKRIRREKEEKKKKKIQVWNFGLEHLFCLELLYLLV